MHTVGDLLMTSSQREAPCLPLPIRCPLLTSYGFSFSAEGEPGAWGHTARWDWSGIRVWESLARLTPGGTIRDWLLTPPASFIVLCALGFPHADHTGPL